MKRNFEKQEKKSRGNLDVKIHSSDPSYVPVSLNNFEEAQFPRDFYKIFDSLGFKGPTPIQALGIPIAIDQKDVIGIAKTGSGKTLSFVLPALLAILEEKQYCKNQRKMYENRKAPLCLILAPTRELAVQIYEASKQFGRRVGISISVIYGGANPHTQREELWRGVDLLIATPGRLLDFIQRRNVFLDKVFYFVLDEADRMLDMGFMPQVKSIVDYIPTNRQTLLWSATWPREVERLSKELCKDNVVKLKVGSDDLTINSDITQNIVIVNHYEKRNQIKYILNQMDICNEYKALIFVKTKRGCDSLARELCDMRMYAAALHGDKSQNMRDRIVQDFKRGYKNILVATDVASRGLDIKDIRVVINYDFPMTIEDYIHRIGRTGRAGAKGTSYTFFCDDDKCFASDLIKIMKKSSQDVPEELYGFAERNAFKGKGKRRYNNKWGAGKGHWFQGGGRKNGRFGGGKGGQGWNARSGFSNGQYNGQVQTFNFRQNNFKTQSFSKNHRNNGFNHQKANKRFDRDQNQRYEQNQNQMNQNYQPQNGYGYQRNNGAYRNQDPRFSDQSEFDQPKIHNFRNKQSRNKRTRNQENPKSNNQKQLF